MGITDTQSYSLVIRDVLYDAVAGDPFFANYTKRTTPMLRLQPELLPYLAVYFVDEDMAPDGDFNAGAVRFSHTLQIGFSVMLANNDPVNAELQPSEALECRKAARTILENLVAADPNNLPLQDDLSAILDALGHRTAALAIDERLVQADPSNARWQGMLASSNLSMGGVRLQEKN